MPRSFKRASGPNLPMRRIARKFTGHITYSQTQKGIVVKKWPRARGKKGTPAQLQARADFTKMVRMVQSMSISDHVGAMMIAEGSSYTWRDVLSRAVTGTLIQTDFSLVEGDIAKTVLDYFGTTPGMMLVCTADGWVALDPPGDNELLYAHPAGALSWVDAATVVGGSVDLTPYVKWTALVDAGAFSTAGSYVKGEIVTDASKRWLCKADIAPSGGSAAAFDSSARNGSGAGATTVTLTTTAAGLIVANCMTANTDSIASVTATGLTFTRLLTHTGSTAKQEIWYAYSSAPVTGLVITVTPTSGSGVTADVIACKGVSAATPFDPNAALPALNTGAYPTPPSVSGITATSGTLALFMLAGNQINLTAPLPSGWTQINNYSSGAGYDILSAYRDFSTPPSGASIAYGSSPYGGYGWAASVVVLTDAAAAIPHPSTDPTHWVYLASDI